jgi:ABC-2 type transport system ATP-binding protein
MSDLALDAVELVKTYPAGRGTPPVRALDGLTIRVRAGSVFALLGPNGAGKSTTVKILTTLSRADSGAATVAGFDVVKNPGAVRRSIGLVSQKPSGDPMATGRENLVLAGRIQGLSRPDARARAASLLDRFGLTDAADRLTKTYSGGMARKLDVAIGLIHRPQVLFLDEPTTGLDPEARAQMWAEIERLAADERTTVLLTTHYGRVVVEGTPEQLKSELRGDAVQVELASAESALSAQHAIAELRGVRDVSVDGTTLRARADSGARAVPAVLAALDDARVEVASVTVARPSLDDVYLRHAGRSFEAAA